MQDVTLLLILYLRYMWGSSNSTSTSRTILQKGDPWKRQQFQTKTQDHTCACVHAIHWDVYAHVSIQM